MRRVVLAFVILFSLVPTLLLAGGGSEEPPDDDQLRYEGNVTIPVAHTIRLEVTRLLGIESYHERRLDVNVGLRNVYSLGHRIASYQMRSYALMNDRFVRSWSFGVTFTVTGSRSNTNTMSSSVIQWTRTYDYVWSTESAIAGFPVGYSEAATAPFPFRYDDEDYLNYRL